MASILSLGIEVFLRAGQTLWSLLPYVLVGVVLGELLKFTSWTRMVLSWIPRGRILSVFVAAVIGVISPLCTFGTIPVVIQLYRSKVPLAPLAAFLSASSMMNPQLFFYTLGGIGLEMAVVRLLAVLLLAVLLGLILYRIPDGKVTRQTIQAVIPTPVSPWMKTRSFSLLCRNSLKSLEYVGFYMVIGVLAAAFVEFLFPIQSMLALVKPGRWEAILLADLLGIPLYVCGGGTIPLVSSMLQAGMAKGAALSFFLAGPATRITSLSALSAILRPWFIVAFALSVVLYAFVAGMLYH